MFDESKYPGESPATAVLSGLAEMIDRVNALDTDQTDAILIEHIGQLERLRSACAAAQARLTHAFAVSQTAEGAAQKVRPETTQRSIVAQIALARRISRHHGQQVVGLAQTLVTEMPCTLSALGAGDLSERRAGIVREEFNCLTPADRTRADAMIASELPGLGDRTAQSRAAAIAYQLDPEAVLAKIRAAVKDRHVSFRPAPDTMGRLSALLPAAQGVAVYAALLKSADSSLAAGDARTRSQIMADDLVSRITGQRITGCDADGVPQYEPNPEIESAGTGSTECSVESDLPRDAESGNNRATDHTNTDRTNTDRTNIAAGDSGPSAAVSGESAPCAPGTSAPGTSAPGTGSATGSTPAGGSRGGLQLSLIMTDRTLFGDNESAHLVGYGSIPAALARALLIGHADAGTATWVRRLYTDPAGTQLVTMDSRQRLFPANAQKFLIARDRTCRTPWCDAPIRHIDHINPYAKGGPTHLGNGQGLCQACNLSKQAPGWDSRAQPDGTIDTTTPTGHTYPSKPPPLPSPSPWQGISAFEERLARALRVA